MKYIGKFFSRIFKVLYAVIDKVIVTPISRVIYSLGEFLKVHNFNLDYILNRPHFMIYVSLILAVVVFFLIDSRVINLVESEAEVLADIPVKVNYNEEAYVVEGIPEAVDITLIGRKSDIYLAKQIGTNAVILDLSNYEARDSAYKVYLSYTKSIDSINYKLDPSYVSVTIKEKISVAKTIDYDLVNESYLNERLSVEKIELSNNEVVVKGSEETINKIATVKALIDLKNESLREEGVHEVDNINVVAYDSKGQIVEGLEIVPKTLSATITLDSYSKSVPLKILTTGNLVTGKAIASILINNENRKDVVIYGDQDSINKITNVPVTINVDGGGATATKAYNVNINKPSGVRAINEKKASITVTFGDEKQKEIDITNVITSKNLGSNLTANIDGTTTESVKAIVKGVQSVIDSITSENITAYLDLDGYGVGEHSVPVIIDNDDPKLNYIVGSVTVRITSAS